MTGNFPQAFSHVPLVYTARNLSHALEGVTARAGPVTATRAPSPGPARARAMPDLGSTGGAGGTDGSATPLGEATQPTAS